MDKELVKKIEILRWGNFYFSRNFDSEKMEDLLKEARYIYSTIIDLPILPDIFSRLEEDVIRRSIHGTAALEGNPLSEEKISKIVSESDKNKFTLRAEREIINLKDAYHLVKTHEIKEGDFHVTEKIIKSVHELIVGGIDEDENRPGMYRTNKIKVGDKDHGGTYTPPKGHKYTQMLMKELIQFINSKNLLGIDPVLRAAFAHFYLCLIHPFEDGNGRTARIIEAILIRSAGIKYFPTMLSNYYYRHMDDYYWAFSLAGKNKQRNITPFLKFVVTGIIESLKSIKDNIILSIRVLMLKDYFLLLSKERIITQRQYDLLIMLLNSLNPISLFDLRNASPYSILYRNVSERTVRRDLKKLQTMKLLNVLEDKKYELNVRVLDKV